MMKRGIDVSTYQGVLDWKHVKSAGIDFAMIKATQGRSETNAALRNFTDSKFTRNITEASRLGIRCGVYHYLTAQTVTEAMQEAEYFVSVLAPYKSLVGLWAVADVESKHLPQDKTLLSQIVHAFCSRVQAAGYDPMVYTNPDWLKNRLNDMSAWPLWLALWRNKSLVPTVGDYPNLYIWQWGKETLNGVSGTIDANYLIREKPEETPKPEVKPAPAPETPIIDNTPSAWAEDAVKWAQDNKIITGDKRGDLGLHRAVTVEQMCVMLRRTYDLSINTAVQRISLKLLSALGGIK